MRRTRNFAIWAAMLVMVFGVLACALPSFGGGGDLNSSSGDEPAEINLTTGDEEGANVPLPTIMQITQDEPGGNEVESDEPPLNAHESVDIPQGANDETDESVQLAVNQADGAVVVYVPEGEFLMGNAANNAKADEVPAHMVYLDSYWLYQTTVTNRQYRECIIGEVCKGTLSRYAENDLPAVNVTWFSAMDYCTWVGGRLPTEAEWEKGARGTDGRDYPWGDTTPTCGQANYKNCFGSEAVSVGLLPAGASPYGALDMVGNVWEWVYDWYDEAYYSVSPYENPTGPTPDVGNFRGQRGASFESNPDLLYIMMRSWSGPDKADYRKGFRCVIPETP